MINENSRDIAIKDYTSVLNLVETIKVLINICDMLGSILMIAFICIPVVPIICLASPFSNVVTLILIIIPFVILFSLKHLFKYIAIAKQKELSILYVSIKCNCKEDKEYKKVIDESGCLWKYSHYAHMDILNLLDE